MHLEVNSFVFEIIIDKYAKEHRTKAMLFCYNKKVAFVDAIYLRRIMYMKYYLENDEIRICVNSFGAELTEIIDKESGQSYMWNADPAFWKRTAPVLFPFVGSVRDKKYNYMGQEFPMGQHGFARDNEFKRIADVKGSPIDSPAKGEKVLEDGSIAAAGDMIWFEFSDNAETAKVYPFEFILRLGYELDGRDVIPHWVVINPSEDSELYYSLGGHPAFMCPALVPGEKDKYELVLFNRDYEPVTKFITSVIGNGGLLSDVKKEIKAPEGVVAITPELFAEDALIIEDGSVKGVGLAKAGEEPYLTVFFEAPLVGIWSPPGKNAPFICIEPWYGRADKENFEGSLEEREWGNVLTPGDSFHTSYTIMV